MHSNDTETLAIAAEQARKVRALYPELYGHLTTRDRELRRTLGRLPQPMDNEGWLSSNVRELIRRAQIHTAPGLDDLARHGT